MDLLKIIEDYQYILHIPITVYSIMNISYIRIIRDLPNDIPSKDILKFNIFTNINQVFYYILNLCFIILIFFTTWYIGVLFILNLHFFSGLLNGLIIGLLVKKKIVSRGYYDLFLFKKRSMSLFILISIVFIFCYWIINLIISNIF